MNVKIVWFFECVQTADRYASASLGWTETLYGFSSTLNNLDSWLQSNDVENYVALRLQCMPSIYRIAWIRVSDEANPRSYKVMALDAKVGTADVTAGGLLKVPPAQVNCALLVDLVRLPDNAQDHTHHRRFLMRGLPVDVINGNVVNTLGQHWPNITNFLNWLAFHESGFIQGPHPLVFPAPTTLGLRYQNPANQAYSPSPAVSPVANDANSISVATTLLGVPGATDYVFRGFPDSARDLNRTWRLAQTFVGPPAVSILGRTRRALQNATYTPPGRGVFRQVNYVYNLFNQYTIIGLRNKKTGRIFRQLRGRSGSR